VKYGITRRRIYFSAISGICKNCGFKNGLQQPFAFQHYIISAAVVWNTPVGPLSFSAKYYDHQQTPVSFLFHFGYIMFNKRALE